MTGVAAALAIRTDTNPPPVVHRLACTFAGVSREEIGLDGEWSIRASARREATSITVVPTVELGGLSSLTA